MSEIKEQSFHLIVTFSKVDASEANNVPQQFERKSKNLDDLIDRLKKFNFSLKCFNYKMEGFKIFKVTEDFYEICDLPEEITFS